MEKDMANTYKASNKLYLFGIVRKYLCRQLDLNIFKAMVMPYLEYTFLISVLALTSPSLNCRGCRIEVYVPVCWLRGELGLVTFTKTLKCYMLKIKLNLIS